MKTPYLAVFDLDHTLLNGDSSQLWSEEMVRLGWIERLDEFQAQHRQLMDTYAHGNLDMETYLALNLSPLVGKTYQEVAITAESFVKNHLIDRIYQQGLDLVRRLRIDGHHLLMISASESFLVEPLAQVMGFDGVIGIEPELDDGRFTGKPVLPMSYQAGKIHHCHQYAQQMDMKEWPLSFYSDSHNDLPLLNIVDLPVAVNPNKHLEEVAKAQNWSVINFKF